jgi:hypothetical protein
VLNTAEGQRNQNLDEQLAAFPYVNGKLFDEPLPIADFDAATREALLDACALDWSAISPAIFGSLFQSIMDSTARRNLGAHYTSEENILKLIKPLFLDELRAEFERVKGQRNRLFDFHKKLRALTFFDPACGCGNFLVISYRELRLWNWTCCAPPPACKGMPASAASTCTSSSASTSTSFTASRSRSFRPRSPRWRCGWSTTR